MKLIKKIKISFGIFLLCVVIFAVAKDKIFDSPFRSFKKISPALQRLKSGDVKTNVFAVEKTLTYKVYYWSIIPFAKFKFSTREVDYGPAFSLDATSEDSFFKNFITASIHIESLFDRDYNLPYLSMEKTDVKGKVKTKEISFDRENLIANRRGTKTRIAPDTNDALGAFVHMLALPFRPQDTQTIKLLSKDEIYVLSVSLFNESRGIMELLVEINREDLTSVHGAKFHVWVTKDTTRIPLIFKSWTPVGYVCAVLTDIELN